MARHKMMRTGTPFPEDVIKIMCKLRDNGYDAFIVGGAVRDWYLELKPHDFDIFTNATGEQILELFHGSKVMGGEERQAKILTVIVDGIEVSQYRSNGDRTEVGKDLRAHCSTCDFTCNAMAMDISGTPIDFHNGMRDLEHKMLRFVGDPLQRIKEDPLRIMRGIRFSLSKDLKFERATLGAMCDHRNMLLRLPHERLREELLKIIVYPGGAALLKQFGILQLIIPEFEEVYGVEGGDHHNEPVEQHCFYAADTAARVTDSTRTIFAAMVHDIGKGRTQTKEINNIDLQHVSMSAPAYERAVAAAKDPHATPVELDCRNGDLGIGFTCDDYDIHFYQHEIIGADMIKERMEMLKFSTEDIKYVSEMVRLHMYGYRDKPSKKSYIRFFAKLAAAGIPIEDYIMLIYSDHQGNQAKPRIKFGDFIAGNWLYKKWQEITYSEEPLTVKDLKIGGKDVIDVLKCTPGPYVGEVLKGIFEAVMDGEYKNERAELMNILKLMSKVGEEATPTQSFEGVHLE